MTLEELFPPFKSKRKQVEALLTQIKDDELRTELRAKYPDDPSAIKAAIMMEVFMFTRIEKLEEQVSELLKLEGQVKEILQILKDNGFVKKS